MNIFKMKLEKNELSEHDALLKCFELIKLTIIRDVLKGSNSKKNETDIYNRFREYKRRYNSEGNTLGDKARKSILEFFGYELVKKVYKKKTE